MIPKVYSSDDFESKFTYSGDDLGARWSPEKTAFRLWAPTASKAGLRLYKSGNINEKSPYLEIQMKEDIKGTWVAEVSGNLNGAFYTFFVIIDGEEREACDPYARAVGLNGERAMVIDLSATNPEGWENDEGVFYDKCITDAVIYEMHVRDLSSDENSGIEHKGKFLGVCESGRKTPGGKSTGMDHIKELGITHVHLLPSFDYGSVDESKPDGEQYNWGYDPMNFNVPEGSYATSAEDGAVRIKEMKQMVKTLHENKLGVVMDMVYNHVYKTEEFCLNKLVPGYFSRTDENGRYSAGSGCGNDTASERSMVKKYIVDSVKYWADEYHIDGFRFDLSGLLDVATMNEITRVVHGEHPNIIFYCEGWMMDTHVTKPIVELAHQYNSEKMPGCSFFSDTVRDALRGRSFGEEGSGFITGGGFESVLKKCFFGMPDWCKNPAKSINYVSCHDGLTLFDKIGAAVPDADFAEKVKRNNLAAAFYILAQGVPLMLAGEEMLRVKHHQDGKAEHNSYNCPDELNSIKWLDLEKPEYGKVFDYYKGLIAFRKAHGALRLRNAQDVCSHITIIEDTKPNTLAFHIWGNINGETAEAIYVIYNANKTEEEFELPIGNWHICIDGETAGTDILYSVEGKITVPALSAVVMIK